MKTTEEQIDRLIETVDFDQLSTYEKDVVLGRMSRHEYEQRRMALLLLKEAMQDDLEGFTPDPGTRLALDGKFEEDEQAILPWWGVLFSWLQKPVPVYSVALPLLLILFLIPWGYDRFVVQSGGDIVEMPKSADTVYITQHVPVERVDTLREFVEVPVIKYVDSSKKMDGSYSSVRLPSLPASSDAEIRNKLSDQLMRSGSNASSNRDLEQFLTTVP